MPSLASGNSSWTACASTCAVECRSTARPSSVSIGTDSTTSPSSGTQARSRSNSPLARATTASMPRSWKTRPIVVPDSTTRGEPSTVRRMSAMQPRLSACSTVLDRRADGTTEQELDGLGYGGLGLAVGRRDELVHDRQVTDRGLAHLEGRLPARRAALHAHGDDPDAWDVDLADDRACFDTAHGRAVRHTDDLP